LLKINSNIILLEVLDDSIPAGNGIYFIEISVTCRKKIPESVPHHVTCAKLAIK